MTTTECEALLHAASNVSFPEDIGELPYTLVAKISAYRPKSGSRPISVTDDLAWLKRAMEDCSFTVEEMAILHECLAMSQL